AVSFEPGHVPDPRAISLAAGRGKAVAIGAERDDGRLRGMSPEAEDLLARACFPDLHGPVLAGRGQMPAAGAEAHAIQDIIVSFKGEDFPAADHLPEPHRLVIPGRGEPPPVGAERHCEDGAGVRSLEGEDCASAGRVPDLDTPWPEEVKVSIDGRE